MIKQYMQELRKEEYRLARRNYTNKCIELTVKYYHIVKLVHIYNRIYYLTFILCLLGSRRYHSQFESLQ